MSDLDQLELTPRLLNIASLPGDILYVGATGFEDRSLGFLKDSCVLRKKFKMCIAIEYQPFAPENRKVEFENIAKSVFAEIRWKTYDRARPENFSPHIEEILTLSKTASQIVIDISAMSKMLIVVLLQGLRKVSLPLSIIYAPAKTYYPLREDYEKAKSKFVDAFPYFLTTDVYKVVTTTELSSIAMQGAPLALIAFPNFNHLEIAALLNETNAQKLFLIESVRDPKHNAWRLEAIRWINRGLARYVTPITKEVDASDINANIRVLEEIYDEMHLTHKTALSPTGGKIQAFATFCFKNMHPEVHIVYPVVREFSHRYTEGHLPHCQFFFENFADFVENLNRYRTRRLFEIQQILQRKEDVSVKT